MDDRILSDAFSKAPRDFLFPHADWDVVSRLRRLGLRRKLINYLWVEFLMARGSTRLWGGRPYWLTLDPVNFCQLHCPFCPTGANRGVRDKSRMRLDHFKKLMDRLGPTVIHMDMMNWGEPLLNPDLPEMIAYAKRFGVEVRLDSNFNDVTERMVDGLILSGLDMLGVSIDGLTQETYGKYRIGGSLRKVMENLDLLVSRRRELGRASPRIIWQVLAFRHNEHEIPWVEAFARSKGADAVDIKSPYMPTEPGYLWEWLPRDPRYQLYALPSEAPDPESADRARRGAHMKRMPVAVSYHASRFHPGHVFRGAYLARLFGMIRGPGDLASVLRQLFLAGSAAWRRGRSDGGGSPGRSAAARRSLCKWPWAGITVNPEGSVSPCCSVEDQADDFGNVFREGWGSLWEGTLYRKSRRHVSRYAAGREGILADDGHVCLRCGLIGRVNFQFPATWTSESPPPSAGGSSAANHAPDRVAPRSAAVG